MVAGYTAAQVRAAEKPHLERGEPLMRMAAAALAEVVREQLARSPDVTPSVLVLAGSGDNGGDALFAAAELAGDGARVDGRADRTHGCTPRRAPRPSSRAFASPATSDLSRSRGSRPGHP